MRKILIELIGSLVVCLILSLIVLVLMELAIDAVVKFVLWTAIQLEMEWK